MNSKEHGDFENYGHYDGLDYGLVGYSFLPRFLLYPLIAVIIILMLIVCVFLVLLIIGYITGDISYLPINLMGWYGPTMGIGLNAMNYQTSECYANGIRVDCSELNYTRYSEFYNDTNYMPIKGGWIPKTLAYNKIN